MNRTVIVGAGQAGVALAAKLRALRYDGEIVLLSDEDALPYHRPPLSKAYLLGDLPFERMLLKPEKFYRDFDIGLRMGARVEFIDRKARAVTVSGGTLAYDHLVLATGSHPRRLPAALGGDLNGVYTLRGLADVDSFAPEFTAGRRLVVIGGGYIGLEAAAVGIKKGLDVTLIEAAPRILQRVACAETADYFRELHRRNGVSLVEDAAVEAIVGNGRAERVRLADGREIAADFVIVGIGVDPATALAGSAGLDLDNGIRTDAFGRTSDTGIWALGDCASFPWEGRQLRLESVGNAIDHADCIAGNIVGHNTPYRPKPWFWSDQYDVKLQIAGLNTGYETIVARPGEAGGVSHWYYRGSTLLAVDAMNDPRAYVVANRLIRGGVSPDPAEIARTDIELKSLLPVVAA